MYKLVLLIFSLQLIGVWTEDHVSYENYRVYTVAHKGIEPIELDPVVANDVMVLVQRRILDQHNNTYSTTTYLVPEVVEEDFLNAVKALDAELIVETVDLEVEIEAEKYNSAYTKLRNSAPTSYIGDRYLTYDEMLEYFDYVQAVRNPKNNQTLAVVESIGESFEHRPIYVVKISSDHDANRPIVLIEAGVHAREWTSPATALFTINQLVENYTLHTDLLQHVDYYVIPVVNPDGYEYSRIVDRMWRKTRSINDGYFGVDLNRNFDFHWGETGTSTDPDSDIYGGPKPFSEPESVNVRDVGVKYQPRIKTYLSVHAYGPCIAYPWSYKKTTQPSKGGILDKMAKEAAAAIKYYSGTQYLTGTSAFLTYESAGGSDDYFKGVLGVDNVFLIELSAGRRHTFVTPPNHLYGIVSEAFEGIKKFGELTYEYSKPESRAESVIDRSLKKETRKEVDEN